MDIFKRLLECCPFLEDLAVTGKSVSPLLEADKPPMQKRSRIGQRKDV